MCPRPRLRARTWPLQFSVSALLARSATSRQQLRSLAQPTQSTQATRTRLHLPPARWHADLKARIGNCILFGCSEVQIARAAKVLRVLAVEWRSLMAGSEAFLTGRRRGLEGQAVVWGEMDSFQHVNNVVYIRYAESSRVNWVTDFASIDAANGSQWRNLMTPTGTGLILKSIKADYKFPITYPDRISVYHKLRFMPSATDTSLVLDCVVLSHKHRRIAARTEEEIVIYDYEGGRKTAMPPFMLDQLRDTFRAQEAEVGNALERIWGLVSEVEALERGTWDRDDAVEDLGAAVATPAGTEHKEEGVPGRCH